MASKENKKLTEDQDKDFGFPFVDVVPLEVHAVNENITEKIEETQKAPFVEEVEPTIEEEFKASNSSKSDQPQEIEEVITTTKPIEIKRQDRTIATKERKSSNKTPIFLSLTLLVLILLGAMAYFLYYLPEYGEPKEQLTEESSRSAIIEESVTPSAIEPVDDDAVASEEILKERTTEVAAAEVVENQAPALTLIQSREGNPRYFIIVGSVVNENFARREAEKYLNDGYDTWIVFPYGDIRNFRVAIGQFESLEAATPDWEAAKKVYGNEIWILKY
ncbi:hypothetical protein SAMN06295967_10439 [Belliella buryatensis]|uniref:SPOR domain-containing protein n=1 Tax=Belliella buryatensis TaxID=1500549 RepID=A0A239C285_9BACT|nr:SPOR domain-containing protein [Belliella buryatensis]SNS14240.1 hypothetical protein SAMN06295967_10439 [Belliella buryatensis]